MGRPALEVADIFRAHGLAWRQAQHGHLSLGQLKVMSAIEQCRSAVLGGHVLRCDTCDQVEIAYNSCRNRHCPKCQASAAKRWLEAREGDVPRPAPGDRSETPNTPCRTRHCPKCQASAAKRWLEARQADLLPVEYYHVVFTLPAAISAIAWYNKAVIYGLLFDVAAETLRTIAA